MKTPKPVRCAVYTRKSTDENLDLDFNSLDAQREAGRAYVASQKAEGWICLPERYDDPNVSGGTMDRPALNRLLADVETGKVDCIVVYKLDRLSRSLLDFARIMAALEEYGASFVSVTQQIDTSTSTGKLMLNILFSFAQFEREIISERTRDKLAAARRRGKWVGGCPTLGYDIVPGGGRITVNEAEAAQVREIFALYAEKQSLVETIRELDRRGWRMKCWKNRKGEVCGGTYITSNNLHRLLANPLYIGLVKHKDVTYAGEHEAIVDQKLWERVQGILKRNGRAGGRAVRNRSGALLSGLVWCEHCGVRMTHGYTQKPSRRYRYYVCTRAQKRGWHTCPTKSVPAVEIERFVVEQIRSIGADPALLAEVVKAVASESKRRATAAKREQRSLERDLRRWSGEIKGLIGNPDAESIERLRDLQARSDAAEQRLQAMQAEPPATPIDVGELEATLERFSPVWDALSPREQARVIQLLVERVAYDGEAGEITIQFRATSLARLTQQGAA